jgi:hypothetical protein
VHVDVSSTTSAGSIGYSDDATASGGRQIVTVNKTEHLTILFIAGVAYVQADANGLGFFGVPQSQAEQFARKRISSRASGSPSGPVRDNECRRVHLPDVVQPLGRDSAPHRAGQHGPSLPRHTRLFHHMMAYIG